MHDLGATWHLGLEALYERNFDPDYQDFLWGNPASSEVVWRVKVACHPPDHSDLELDF